jgi:hypothetical protein
LVQVVELMGSRLSAKEWTHGAVFEKSKGTHRNWAKKAFTIRFSVLHSRAGRDKVDSSVIYLDPEAIEILTSPKRPGLILKKISQAKKIQATIKSIKKARHRMQKSLGGAAGWFVQKVIATKPDDTKATIKASADLPTSLAVPGTVTVDCDSDCDYSYGCNSDCDTLTVIL